MTNKINVVQYIEDRIASNDIIELKDDEIFVFGSNIKGIHRAGAAKIAYEKFGAIWGKGMGIQGKSYAVPTKDEYINTLDIIYIQKFVLTFIEYAKSCPKKVFLVTEIGCGSAGYTNYSIAPLFRKAIKVDNIHLPKSFWEIINKS